MHENITNVVPHIIVYAKNVRSLSLSSGTKIIQLLGELKNIEWDVILISESRSLSGKYILDGVWSLESGNRSSLKGAVL